MRSPSIEWLYGKLDKHIKLVESYSEIKYIEYIIIACRLKPYSYIFEDKDSKLILHRKWFDEFGNLFILNEKKVEIIYNDLSIDRKRLTCTDLYYGLSLNKIAKISKNIFIMYGKDDDLNEDCYLITFVGIDNYFRTYLYLYGEWQQVSPLLMGMKYLKLLSKNLDTDFKYLKIKKNIPIPCLMAECWLSYLPPNQNLIKLLSNHNEISNKIIL